jgi:hypothetical protein
MLTEQLFNAAGAEAWTGDEVLGLVTAADLYRPGRALVKRLRCTHGVTLPCGS